MYVHIKTAQVLAMIMAIFCACTSGGDSKPSETTPNNTCSPLDKLLSDSSGASIQAATNEHIPTQQEINRAALIWSIAMELYQGQITDERLVGPELTQLLADVPNEYPSIMSGCTGSGKTSQALITTKDDFACNNPCVPSADLFKKSVDKLTDKIVGTLLGTALSKKSKEIVDGATALLESGKDLKQAADNINHDDAASVITNMSSAAGTIAGVAGALEMAGAAEIAAVIGAFQIGWEIGTVINLVIECKQWKSANCGTDSGAGGTAGSAGSGGSTGGSGGTSFGGSAGSGGVALDGSDDTGTAGTDSGSAGDGGNTTDGGAEDSKADDASEDALNDGTDAGCVGSTYRCNGKVIEYCSTFSHQWTKVTTCLYDCVSLGADELYQQICCNQSAACGDTCATDEECPQGLTCKICVVGETGRCRTIPTGACPCP